MSSPRRVLFVCTGNSARSQIAQALLTHLGGDRFHAESAGTEPAAQVNPGALEALRDAGIPWRGHAPRRLDGLEREHWDLVVTVCDEAKEACPLFPAGPIVVHWGMPDPTAVEDPSARRSAFVDTLRVLRARIAALVQLDAEAPPRDRLAARLSEIARSS